MGTIAGFDQADQAREYYEKALLLGFKMPTLFNLGSLLLDMGRAFQQPIYLSEAVGYLAQSYAIDGDDATLKKLITASSLAHRFTPKDQKLSVTRRQEAVKWLDIGIAQKESSAYQNYGALLYYEGDVVGATPYFKQALAAKVPEAAYALGLIYLNGEGGVAKDEAQALHYFELAAKNGQRESKDEVDRIWSNRFTRARTIADFQEIVDGLSSYDESEGSFFYTLNRAKEKLRQMRLVEGNLHRVSALPEGLVRFNLCLTDVPGPNGAPMPNTDWRVVEIADPSSDPITLPALVGGKTDLRGCISIDSNGAQKLKQALIGGHTLVWIAHTNVRFLALREPVSAGNLELILDPT